MNSVHPTPRLAVKKKPRTPEPLEKPAIEEVIGEKQADAMALTAVKDELHKVEATSAEGKEVAIKEPIEKPMVLEYRLDEIKPSPSVTEPIQIADEKEKSGFRKVIDFAIDAKNSSPMADLRDAKDGLFAMNFKKDKSKNAK